MSIELLNIETESDRLFAEKIINRQLKLVEEAGDHREEGRNLSADMVMKSVFALEKHLNKFKQP